MTDVKSPESYVSPKFLSVLLNEGISAIANDFGVATVDSALGESILQQMEETFGPSLTEKGLSLSLPFAATFVRVLKGLVRTKTKGWSKEADESVNELIDDWFEGMRMQVKMRGKMNEADLTSASNTSLEKARENMKKKLKQRAEDQASYETALQSLDEEIKTRMLRHYFSLPVTHQHRFNSLKGKLKTSGAILLYLRELEIAADISGTSDPAQLLELIEPAYGVKPADPDAVSIDRVVKNVTHAAGSVLGRVERKVVDVIKNPDLLKDFIGEPVPAVVDAKVEEREKRIVVNKKKRWF